MIYKDGKIYDNWFKEGQHILAFNDNLTENAKNEYAIKIKYGIELLNLLDGANLDSISEVKELRDEIAELFMFLGIELYQKIRWGTIWKKRKIF